MNWIRRAGVGAAAVLVLTAAPASVSGAAAVRSETPRGALCHIALTLPSFGAGGDFPTAVNRRGVVVGNAARGPGSQRVPVVWRWSGPTAIPLPTGFERGGALDINDRGQIVGNIFDADGNIHGYFYDGISVRLLPLLPGGTYSYARRINVSGQIAGMSSAADGTEYAVRWDSATAAPIRLAPATGHNASFSKGINERGEVAGDSDLVSDDGFFTYAAVWSPSGKVRVYAGIGGLGTEGAIFEINDAGVAAGYSASRIDYSDPDFAIRATVWTPSGKPTDLGVLAGDNFSEALGLSPDGAAVGHSSVMDYSTFEPTGTDHAFYWPGRGPMLALPTIGPDDSSLAHQITAWGVIVGQVTPVDAPTQGVLWHC